MVFYCFLTIIFQVTFKYFQNIVGLRAHFVKFSWKKCEDDECSFFITNCWYTNLKISKKNILTLFNFFFFFFFSNLKAVEKYLEAFNFSVFVDCYKKENSEKVIKEAISCQYVKKKYFSQITDKCSLRRNSLKALFLSCPRFYHCFCYYSH